MAAANHGLVLVDKPLVGVVGLGGWTVNFRASAKVVKESTP